MKQKFKNTVKQLMIVPSIILGLLCVVSVATAQKPSTPPKQSTDIMLNKRNANEVIQRALAEWGAEMLATQLNTTDYTNIHAKFSILHSLQAMNELNPNSNISKCIEEAGRIIWAEKIIKEEATYNFAINEVRQLLLKKNNPGYKE